MSQPVININFPPMPTPNRFKGVGAGTAGDNNLYIDALRAWERSVKAIADGIGVAVKSLQSV